jgi:hypothetical protein
MKAFKFKQVDFISSGPYFMIQNQYKEKSNYGALLSLIVIFTIVFLSWMLGNDIFYRQTPSVLDKEEFLEFFPKFDFNETNIFFTFRIEDTYGAPIPLDESIASFSLFYSKFYPKDNSTISQNQTRKNSTFLSSLIYEENEIDLGNCEYLYENYPNFLPLGDLREMNCPKKENLSNFEIYGTWTTPDFSYLVIYLKKCDRNHTVCKSDQEIEDYLSGTYLSVYFSDSILRPREYAQPVRKVMKNIYQLINLNQYKDVELTFATMSVETDSGWLIPETNSQNFSMYSGINLDTTIGEGDYLISLWIYQSNFVKVYEREYIKIQTIIANIGGVSRFLILIAYLVNYSYNLKRINLKLMSEIFDYRNNFKEKMTFTRLPASFKDVFRLNTIKSTKKKFNVESKSPPDDSPDLSLPSNKNVEINAVDCTLERIDEVECKETNPKDIDSDKREPLTDKESAKITNAPESPTILRRSSKNDEIDEIKRRRSERIKIKTTKLKYHFWELINSAYCCCFNKLKTKNVKFLDGLYDASLKTIQVYLNVNLLIKKMQEIEHLKYLLFTKEQLMCFNFFEKQEVRAKEKGHIYKRMSLLFNKGELFCSEDDKLKGVLDYYLNDVNKKDLENTEHVDYKLFDLLDKNIKSYLFKNI